MAAVSARSFRDFSTRRIIIDKSINRRLGPNSLDPPSGWRWDYRHVIQDYNTETLPFPGLRRKHLSGVPREYWQNGPISGKTGNDLKIEEVKEVFAQGRRRWAPLIHNGNLNIWRDPTYFFSENSVVEILDPDSIDSAGRSLHPLQKDLRVGSPILATIFRRDYNNEYLPWRTYNRRQRFTGLLDDDGNEQTTRVGDTFYWSAVNTDLREFVSYVKDDITYCLFNKDTVEQVTSLETPSSLLDFNDLEYLGTSDGTNSQRLYTSKFPVSLDSDIKVYSVYIEGAVWTTYEVVEEFTGYQLEVKLDKDLGILSFPSSAMLDIDFIPPIGRALYIAYNAVPRIEYEEDGYNDVAVTIDADVSPLGQSLNRGFVTLSRAELDIASIILETTKPSYPGIANTFGPIYAGADYAPLKATVYSSSGEEVPNVEVTFFFNTNPSFGSLGTSGETAQRRTSVNGIARTYYVPPVSTEAMGFDVDSITAGNILTVNATAQFSETDDIYTYYVLKDDPLIGIAGADTSIGEVEWDPDELNGRRVVLYKWDATAVNPISGHYGAYVPIRPTTITNGYQLTYADTLADPEPESYGEVIESGTATSFTLDFITDTAKSWTTNQWRGYVVASVSEPDIKRRIVSNTNDTLYFSSRINEYPTTLSYEIFDKTDNLGGYWVISDRFISIMASAYSPRLGRTIYSNTLSLRVEIPDYMKGSYISDSLQEIPFGWRLVDDTYEQASAINGATYISINPVAGPYPIVDVIGGDNWDNYSGDDPDAFWPYGAYPTEGAAASFANFSLSWEVIS